MAIMTPETFRVARSLLKISLVDFAAHTGVSKTALSYYGSRVRDLSDTEYACVKSAMEEMGIVFIEGGVELKAQFDEANS